MHKIILSLLIVLSVPTHAMLWLTPNLSFTYKRGCNKKTTLSDIPKDIILSYFFQESEMPVLYELLTLVKEFGHTSDTKTLLKPIAENFLFLINLSETSTFFNTMLEKEIKEIKERTSLSHVSYNSLNFFKNCNHFNNKISIFNLEYESTKNYFAFSASLIKNNKVNTDYQIYDKNIYLEIENLCNKIMNKIVNNNEITNVCEALQKECALMLNLSSENIKKLENWLNTSGETFSELSLLEKHATLICPTTLELNIPMDEWVFPKNIEHVLNTKKNLFDILPKNRSVPENVIQYLHACNSFLQKSCKCTVTIDGAKLHDHKFIVVVTIPYELSNVPTIPVNLLV